MIDLPTIVARGQQFGLKRSDQVLETFEGLDINIINPHAYWTFNIPVVPRTADEAKEWRAALAKLASVSNTFKASPPGFTETAYSASGGFPLFVDGGGQLGRNIQMKGATPNTQVFKVGEFFEINGELKIVTSDASAGPSGTFTVSCEPAFRNTLDDNDPVIIDQPKATFRLVTSVGGWSLQPNKIHNFNIQAVETY